MKALSREMVSQYVPSHPNEQPLKEPSGVNDPPKDEPARSPSPEENESPKLYVR